MTFRHARLLHVEKFGNYSVARISNPWKAGETLHTYVLVPHDMPVSDRLPSGTVVKVPLQIFIPVRTLRRVFPFFSPVHENCVK